ncbi:MAG: tryptophan synthase subunit alpha [Candidatus Micrarchaeia archaeon]
MNNISLKKTFKKLKKEGKKAFMPYVCCGDLGTSFTESLIETLYKNGADVIELGIPFSDPVADGPTIQAASQRALKGKTTPKDAFEVIQNIRKKRVLAPIVVMAYYNIVFRAGVEKFAREVAKAGGQALLCPDVPIEESAQLQKACKKAKINCIYLAAPNTPTKRLKNILKKAKGFLYLVSVTGITGARKNVAKTALELIKRARKHAKIPLALGFGVSNPVQAREIAKTGASGIIVGSKIINLYQRLAINGRKKQALEKVAVFARQLKNAL